MTNMTAERTRPSQINTAEERRLAPIGAVIRPMDFDSDRDFTKTEPNLWVREGYSSRTNGDGTSDEGWYRDGDRHYTVIEWPTLGIGDHLHWTFEREYLPVGSVISMCGDSENREANTWTKVGVNTWESSHGHGARTNAGGGWLGENSTRNGYEVLLVGSATTTTEVEGGTIESYVDLGSLGEGTQFWLVSDPGHRWTMGPDGYALLDGDPHEVRVALTTFEGPANAGDLRFGGVRSVTEQRVPRVGEELTTYDMFDALPVGARIQWRGEAIRVRDSEGLWPNVNGSDAIPTTHLVTEGWVVIDLPTTSNMETEPEESTITMSAHEAALAAVREQVRQETLEEVLSTVRDHWDGVSFTESEVNSLLSDLGLPNVQVFESVDVEVTINGRSQLSESDIRECIEGYITVDVDDEVYVEWSVENTFTIDEVQQGDCACGEVSREMVTNWLDNNNVSYESFTFERSCDNE